MLSKIVDGFRNAYTTREVSLAKRRATLYVNQRVSEGKTRSKVVGAIRAQLKRANVWSNW